jgi:hypothetical protein
MTRKANASDATGDWYSARLLYPLYTALAREFVIDLTPCSELETGADHPRQSLEPVRKWFEEIDQRIQVYQLRQFLQMTSLTSEEGLATWLQHHLGKANRTDSDRDKIDFLLVQLFAHCAPPRLEDPDVTMAYVGQVLGPLIDNVESTIPESLKPLEQFTESANNCRSLNELLTSGILEQERKLKASVGEKYFEPTAMVAFARFNFLMRRVFFRLMHEDLNSILDGLRDLELKGVSTLDCRSAQFAGDEQISRLRMICQSWKVMFHAEYSSGQPLKMLVDLRKVVEAALTPTGKNTSETPAPASLKAMAAAAGAQPTSSNALVPEFDVVSAPPDPDAVEGDSTDEPGV